MSFFKHLIKLLNTTIVRSNETTIVMKNGETRIVVDGKIIDPKSDKGIKIIDSTKRNIASAMKHVDEAMEEVKKTMETIWE